MNEKDIYINNQKHDKRDREGNDQVYGLTIKDVDFTHASNDAVLHLTTVSKSHRQVNSRVTLDSSV